MTNARLNRPSARSIPRFSSGPCAKIPTSILARLADAPLGRSHRAAVGKPKLKAAIDGTREILGVPDDYRIGIVPASDTGAVEMAMWSLLGERKTTMVAWESFGAGWVTDAVETAEAGRRSQDGGITARSSIWLLELRHRCGVHMERHHVGRAHAAWRHDPGGPRGPDHLRRHQRRLRDGPALGQAGCRDLLLAEGDGRRSCTWDADPEPPCGGTAGKLQPGMAASPRFFRLTKGGKLIDGIFKGETINTPSMLAVEDYLLALDWARDLGGLSALIARCDANAAVIDQFCAANDWIANLAEDPVTASTTSVCLKFTDPKHHRWCGLRQSRRQAAGSRRRGTGYRRLTAMRPLACASGAGATVETADIEALMPWLDWAYHAERASTRLRRLSASRVTPQEHPSPGLTRDLSSHVPYKEAPDQVRGATKK